MEQVRLIISNFHYAILILFLPPSYQLNMKFQSYWFASQYNIHSIISTLFPPQKKRMWFQLISYPHLYLINGPMAVNWQLPRLTSCADLIWCCRTWKSAIWIFKLCTNIHWTMCFFKLVHGSFVIDQNIIIWIIWNYNPFTVLSPNQRVFGNGAYLLIFFIARGEYSEKKHRKWSNQTGSINHYTLW